MSTLESLQELLMKDYALTREQLVPEADLGSLGIDSLGLVELIFAAEDRFGIQIPNEDVALRTLGDVAAYVDRLLAERRAGGGAGGPGPGLSAGT